MAGTHINPLSLVIILLKKGDFFMKENIPVNQQKRNEEYNEYVKSVTPTHNLFLNMIKAFILGGIICLLGQIIVNIGINQFGLEQKDASTYCSIILVLISVILTSLNWYAPLANWGGAGALVPITGFAHAMTSSMIDYKKEGLVTGIGSNAFKLTGSVILYGVLSAYVFGIVRYLFFGG